MKKVLIINGHQYYDMVAKGELTQQFCGLEQLETYSVHDIFKGDLDLNAQLEKFENLLSKNFL